MLSHSFDMVCFETKKSAQEKIPGRFLFYLIRSIAALHSGVGGNDHFLKFIGFMKVPRSLKKLVTGLVSL